MTSSAFSAPAQAPGDSDPTRRKPRDLARWFFFAIPLVLLPLMIWASFDFGATWDEKSRHRYGEFIWMFFRGQRSRSAFGETGGHLYGGLFDALCVGLEQWLPGNRYVIRHIANACFGWIGVVYCGRLAARMFGTWTGVLAMVFLSASPRYFADSMNNPKDIPFAAMVMVALYYISTVSPRWPYLSWKTMAAIAVALALALNIRVGALLYLGYLGLLVALFAILERQTDWRRLGTVALRLAILTVAVLLLGTLIWPWAQGSPFINPIRALFGVASFPFSGITIFAGREYNIGELPKYYILWWFLISTPPVVLAGTVLSVIFSPTREETHRKAALWFVALFPVSLMILMGSVLYDGIRHLLFIYPVVAMLAAAGWTGFIAHAPRRWLTWASAGLLAAGVMSIVIFDVRYHPNQGVYFNQLVSGPKGAFAKYEMDYWGNCVLQAVKWTVAEARSMGMPLAVSGNPPHLVQLDSERFKEVYFTDPRRQQEYLFIRLARGPIGGLNELAKEPALYQVKTPDGAILCTVVPGSKFDEMLKLRSLVKPPQGSQRGDR